MLPIAKGVKVLRIVVASPSDVEFERGRVQVVVNSVNRGAVERGLVLIVTRWETDAFPGFHAGGPQALIDEILSIHDCDIFIGIFWRRFGTPVADAKSGTEHEYKLAYETWQKIGRPQIFFYFNEEAYKPKSKEETDQWGLVLEFKDNFPKEGLWWPYEGSAKFEYVLRDHLEDYLRKKFPLRVTPPPPPRNSFDTALSEIRMAFLQASSEELQVCLFKVRSLSEQNRDHPRVYEARVLERQIENAIEIDTRLSQIRTALLQAFSLQELSDCLYKVRSLIEQFRDHPRVFEARVLEHQIENAIEEKGAREVGIRPLWGQRVGGWMKTVRAHPLFIILAAIVVAITSIGGFSDSVQKLANLFKKSPPPVVVTGAPVRTGKLTGNGRVFSVDQHFWATGKTGDIGDVQIASAPVLDRFTYTTNGLGPHEFEWKYVDGRLNPEPAQFAGVMYLNPPNNFGRDPTGGFDLRGYRVVKWKAHSLTGRVNVDFSMGGVTWVWDERARVQVTPPFPESLSIKRLGIKTLDTNWQEFEAAFAPEDDLRCVINGFAWTINWPSNDVNLNATRTGPVSAREFQFEVRDIRYER